MKKSTLILIIVIVVIVAAIFGWFYFTRGKVLLNPRGIDRPAACREGTSCTAGQTCCWGTGKGSRQITCTDRGTWPGSRGETTCPSGQACDRQGVGGKCVNQGD